MTTAPTIAGFGAPVWVDNFEGPAGLPDANNWNIIVSGPNYGNHEVQNYTNSTSNITLTGSGGLNITPQKDATGVWTSGRLECKQSFGCPENGKMILQAELRTGTAPGSDQAGVWPAFWALGETIRTGVPWPDCGEWDIMENSSGGGFSLASLHLGTNGQEVSVGGSMGQPEEVTVNNQTFNTFTLTVDRTPANWQDQTLTWSLNGVPWYTARGSNVSTLTLWQNSAYQAYFPILNIAIGTNFPQAENGGQPNASTATGLGSGMQVNYVAFYQSTTPAKTTNPTTTNPTTTNPGLVVQQPKQAKGWRKLASKMCCT